LQAVDGHQVHKSWWVAKAALSNVRKSGRKWTIVTTDGTEIPVGRSFESTLRNAGWL
jgi:DNA-binding LytR/AlgR family response regulator